MVNAATDARRVAARQGLVRRACIVHPALLLGSVVCLRQVYFRDGTGSELSTCDPT